MQVGLSVNSAYVVDDVRAGAAQMIDRARAARKADLDALFVGDHHITPVPYYQNSPMLGRLLAEWGVRTAGALFLLPLWHPVLLAEQVGTLSAIAEGPFEVQCAIGPDDVQFPGMGIEARKRPSRFEQSLAILRRLWAGEVVSCDGPWPLREARISPCPPQPIFVWIGGVAEAAIDRAARLGDGWLASPHLTPAQARNQLALYRERCAAHGRPARAAIRRDVYVGESAAEAEATGGAVVRAGHRGFPSEACAVGDVEAVAAHFAELAELGFEQVLARNLVREAGAAVACIERLGAVRSRLREA